MAERDLMNRFILAVILAFLSVSTWAMAGGGGQAEYVITISVDGMGSSYMQQLVDQGLLPNIKRLETQGATTLNARADQQVTVTLPNHTAMITSRPILGEAGHNWVSNTDPKAGQTIHSNKKSYIASVFDVAHDAGLKTGMWATKTKFSLFRDSYDAQNGSTEGPGAAVHGAQKLDSFTYAKTSPALTREFVTAMSQTPCNFAFVHYAEADAAGHGKGWGSVEYMNALVIADGCIGQVIDLVDKNPLLKGKTVIIVTADHGGTGTNHADPANPLDYTIPFLVWGAGVEQGDLYQFNPTRMNPGTERIAFDVPGQPIRNGDVGNFSLKLLGLPAIPGSVIGKDQDIKTQANPAEKVLKKAA